jgi:hypothetical protein
MRIPVIVGLMTLFAIAAAANPTEVLMTSKILTVKDAKTAQKYVLQGNKARVYAKVSIRATGLANSGLRQWLEKRLPASVLGFFERKDRDNGLTVRYKPVPFVLKKNEIFCTRASTPKNEVCHADFAVSAVNAVDIPSGDNGAHTVMLQLLPPENGIRVKIAKAEGFTYHVLRGDPKLSKFGAAGSLRGK